MKGKAPARGYAGDTGPSHVTGWLHPRVSGEKGDSTHGPLE